MKVRVGNLSVYHKFTEIEVDIPKMELDKVADYLRDNEELYAERLDKKMSETTAEFGRGDYYGYGDGTDSETRYDVMSHQFGGHL